MVYKTLKIVFSRFIFTIYDNGIQGVTGDYRGLKEVRRSYGGLQGVRRGYGGLKGVTGGEKGLKKKRVAICVSRAFCSTNQEKRKTARSLVLRPSPLSRCGLEVIQ